MNEKIEKMVRGFCESKSVFISEEGVSKIQKEINTYLTEQFTSEGIEGLSDDFVREVAEYVTTVYLSETRATPAAEEPVSDTLNGMDESRYWGLIDKANACGKNKTDYIVNELEKMSVKDIVAFELLTLKFQKEIHKVNLRDMLYYVDEDEMDEDYEFFIRWIISEGKQLYDNVVHGWKDPKEQVRFISQAEELPTYESFAYLSTMAYKNKRNYIISNGTDDEDSLFMIKHDNYNDAFRDLRFSSGL